MAALIERGANVKAADHLGYIAPIFAVHSGSTPLVQMFLACGAAAGVYTARGMTALSYAGGYKALVSLLLPQVAKAAQATGRIKLPAASLASPVPMASSSPEVPQAVGTGAAPLPPSVTRLPSGPLVPGAL